VDVELVQVSECAIAVEEQRVEILIVHHLVDEVVAALVLAVREARVVLAHRIGDLAVLLLRVRRHGIRSPSPGRSSR
jgi:hypothetical protein